MIIWGHKKVNWHVRHNNIQTHNFPRRYIPTNVDCVTSAPVFGCKIVFHKDYAVVEPGNEALNVYVDKGFAAKIILALQDEPETFTIRGGGIHGMWTVTGRSGRTTSTILTLVPVRKNTKYTAETPCRESLEIALMRCADSYVAKTEETDHIV